MTKIIAISKDGKRSQIINGFNEAEKLLHTDEKSLKNGLLHGLEVQDKETGEIWYIDELFENENDGK